VLFSVRAGDPSSHVASKSSLWFFYDHWF